ncbi:MAG: VCBS repeat-containing protein, partial [Bacteroidota bacterium]
INSGSGSFSNDQGVPFPNLYEGSAAFVDVDSNGTSDLLITGNLGSSRTTKLYLNDGVGNFTEKTGTPFQGVTQSAVAFADVDGNFREDVIIIGKIDATNAIAKLYLNEGAGTFTEALSLPFRPVSEGALAFADVDGDNDQDVVITGIDILSNPSTRLYINDGTGDFTEQTNTSLIQVSHSSVDFFDVDENGSMDLLISGRDTNSNVLTKLYLNDGSGNFSEALDSPLPGVERSAVALADINGDQKLDMLLAGLRLVGGPIAEVFLGGADGTLKEKVGLPFERVLGSSSAFLDVDGDQDEDVIIAGLNGLDMSTKLFLNDGSGNFTERLGTPFVPMVGGAIAYGDVDGNGWPDVLLLGRENNAQAVAKLYLNFGGGNFSEKLNTGLMGLRDGDAAFADVNEDGTLDLLISGQDDSFQEHTKFYLNDGFGNFTEEINTPFLDLAFGSIKFGDLSGDSIPDVVITGSQGASFFTKLYVSDGQGNFNENLNAPFTGVNFGGIAFADVDENGTLDVFISGAFRTDGGTLSKLYLNNGS